MNKGEGGGRSHRGNKGKEEEMCVCEQGRKTQADKEVKHMETKRIQRVLGLEGWYIISADCMPPLGN